MYEIPSQKLLLLTTGLRSKNTPRTLWYKMCCKGSKLQWLHTVIWKISGICCSASKYCRLPFVIFEKSSFIQTKAVFIPSSNPVQNIPVWKNNLKFFLKYEFHCKKHFLNSKRRQGASVVVCDNTACFRAQSGLLNTKLHSPWYIKSSTFEKTLFIEKRIITLLNCYYRITRYIRSICAKCQYWISIADTSLNFTQFWKRHWSNRTSLPNIFWFHYIL